jgi:hypothetical protein
MTAHRAAAAVAVVLVASLVACGGGEKRLLARLAAPQGAALVDDRCDPARDPDAAPREYAFVTSPGSGGVRVVDLNERDTDRRVLADPTVWPLPLTVPAGRRPGAIAASPDHCVVVAADPVGRQVAVIDVPSVLATRRGETHVGVQFVPIEGTPVDVTGAPAGAAGGVIAFVAVHADVPGDGAPKSRVMRLGRGPTGDGVTSFGVEVWAELDGLAGEVTYDALRDVVWVGLAGAKDRHAVSIASDAVDGTSAARRVDVGGPVRRIEPVPAAPGVAAGTLLLALRADRAAVAVLAAEGGGPPKWQDVSTSPRVACVPGGARMDEATPEPGATPAATATATPAPEPSPTPAPTDFTPRDLARCDVLLPSRPVSITFSDGFKVKQTANDIDCGSRATGSARTTDYPNSAFAFAGTSEGRIYYLDVVNGVVQLVDRLSDAFNVPSLFLTDPESGGEPREAAGADDPWPLACEAIGLVAGSNLCCQGIGARTPPFGTETWRLTWEGVLRGGIGRFCPDRARGNPVGCPDADGAFFSDLRGGLAGVARVGDVVAIAAPAPAEGDDPPTEPDCSGDYAVADVAGDAVKLDHAPADPACTTTLTRYELRAGGAWVVRSDRQGLRGRLASQARYDDGRTVFQLRPHPPPARDTRLTFVVDGLYDPLHVAELDADFGTRSGIPVALLPHRDGFLVLWSGPQRESLVLVTPALDSAAYVVYR